jgi:hypothetical protein
LRQFLKGFENRKLCVDCNVFHTVCGKKNPNFIKLKFGFLLIIMDGLKFIIFISEGKT